MLRHVIKNEPTSSNVPKTRFFKNFKNNRLLMLDHQHTHKWTSSKKMPIACPIRVIGYKKNDQTAMANSKKI